MKRNSYAGLAAVSGGGGGRQAGDIVFAAANPGVNSYVPADGSWYSGVSWSALMTAAPNLKQRLNVTTDVTAVSYSDQWQNVCTGKAGELILVGSALDCQFYVSTDGGTTWTAKTPVTPAQMRTALGWGAGPFGEPGSAAVLWDAVSNTYVLAATSHYAVSTESGHVVTEIWSSPDLVTWTYKGLLEDGGAGNYTNAVTSGKTLFRRNAAGDAILCTPLHAYRIAAGSAINTASGWTSNLGVLANGMMATFYRNGTFIALQGTTTFYTSTNGIAWTAQTASVAVYRVECYHPTLGYIFSTQPWSNGQDGGSTPTFYRTTNFSTFTQLGTTGIPSGCVLQAVGAAEDGSTPLFASYYASGPVLGYATSIDGANWTAITAPRVPGTSDNGAWHFEWLSGKVFLRWGNSLVRRLDTTVFTQLQAPNITGFANNAGQTLNAYMKAA